MILHHDVPVNIDGILFNLNFLFEEKRIEVRLDGSLINADRVVFADSAANYVVEAEYDLEGNIVIKTDLETGHEYISYKTKQGKIEIFIDGVLQ